MAVHVSEALETSPALSGLWGSIVTASGVAREEGKQEKVITEDTRR